MLRSLIALSRRPPALLAALSLAALACGGAEVSHGGAAPPNAAPAPAAADAAGDAAGPDDADPPTTTSAAAEEPGADAPAPLELDPGAADPRTLDAAATTSIGSAVDGSLRGALRLPRRGPGYVFNPSKRDEARHGTVEMIQALLAAAAAVERDLPGSQAVLGELSLPEGGPISGHGSHQAGRDVDVLFFLLGADGEPFASKPIPLDPSGAGTEYGDLGDASDDRPVTIDLPRTWRFVQGLLEFEGAAVQRIFLVEHLRGLLLEEAARQGAPQATIDLFADVTCQPGFPHDDHLHIRFFCSPDDIDAGCADMAPIYPWHLARLKAAGRAPAKAKPRSKGSRPKLTSHKEARAKAGPMHEDVTAFLDRRAAWVKQPHPGRKYCR
ncbi:MAG: penicillin-insensitive murein endopeptidase [Nannocystaceae bacterium]